MLLIHCDRCGEELEEPGGLLFDPPDASGRALKRHVCRTCLPVLFAPVTSPPIARERVVEVVFIVNGVERSERIRALSPLAHYLWSVLFWTRNMHYHLSEWELRRDGDRVDPVLQSAADLGLVNGSELYLTLRVGAGG